MGLKEVGLPSKKEYECQKGRAIPEDEYQKKLEELRKNGRTILSSL